MLTLRVHSPKRDLTMGGLLARPQVVRVYAGMAQEWNEKALEAKTIEEKIAMARVRNIFHEMAIEFGK